MITVYCANITTNKEIIRKAYMENLEAVMDENVLGSLVSELGNQLAERGISIDSLHKGVGPKRAQDIYDDFNKV
jgi:hypothetical protein